MGESTSVGNGGLAVQRLAAACGIAGPIMSSVILLIVSQLHPGYSIITQRISELGGADAPYATFMNLFGMELPGILIILLSWGLYAGVRGGISAKVGSILLALSGAALVMAGVFHVDTVHAEMSRSGLAHGFFARMGEFAIIVAPLIMSFGLKKDGRWRGYALFCMATAIAATALYVVYQFDFIAPWKGLVQRMVVTVPLVWIEVMSIKLMRLSFYNTKATPQDVVPHDIPPSENVRLSHSEFSVRNRD